MLPGRTVAFTRKTLEEDAAGRPAGFAADVLAAARVEGEQVTIDYGVWQELRLRYSPRGGLGDQVARVLKPIARGVDRVLGTDLEHCAGCAGRQAKLNKWFPMV